MKRCPVTYYPVATQRQFQLNRAAIQGKPYAHHFHGDLWIPEDVLPALQAPIEVKDALPVERINDLLEPGYLAAENGYCELADGSAYTASLVQLPGCNGDMYRWWFWWHAVESERYTLWYPHNHIEARPLDREVLTRPGLSDEQRYVGTTHHVDEYIGPDLLHVAIRFVEPAEIGLDASRFERAGIVGHACARVGVRGMGSEAVTMVHLARQTAGGIEQRSRYWMGHDPRARTPFGSVSVDWIAKGLRLKRFLAGARVGYEQLLHDQIEFNHLGTFLPALYREQHPA